MSAATEKPDYGVDAPGVMRNFFLLGAALLLGGALLPPVLHLGRVDLAARPSFFWTGGCFLVSGLLFLLYVKVGKFRHRDFMLGLHRWSGAERVLDVGCGRGLLLVGVAKRLATLGGKSTVTGIDVWSNEDMGGNSPAATERNLELEGITGRCALVTASAAEMPFADGSFDVVVSNLCLHNLYDRELRQRAVREIARVLRPGGVALLSDYKLTGEYARWLTEMGFAVTRRWGSVVTTFPPLRVVVARKPE